MSDIYDREAIEAAWEAEMQAQRRNAQRIWDELAAEMDADQDWTGYLTFEQLAPLYGMEAEA